MNFFLFFTFILFIILELVRNKEAENSESPDFKIKKILNKFTREKQALDFLNDAIFKENKIANLDLLLNHFINKNWRQAFKIVYQYMTPKEEIEKKKEILDQYNNKIDDDIKKLTNSLSKKKNEIIRISPVFEWSQDDDTIKIRIKFSKNLETPGEKDIQNFKVNCTRSQLEVQGYKVHPNEKYVVHYYRRLNLYEFIKTHTCKSYKENEGHYIINFNKNQATLFWNFLNQPSEDHYNTYTWMSVHEKYDDKIQYTDFREHAMENLLISDIEHFVKEKMPEKNKRLKRIAKAKNFLATKDKENKNYCLTPAQGETCNIPEITDWGYWLI